MAERAGFEPAVPCGTPDFESGTFDHSATSPIQRILYFLTDLRWQFNTCVIAIFKMIDLHACPNRTDVFG